MEHMDLKILNHFQVVAQGAEAIECPQIGGLLLSLRYRRSVNQEPCFLDVELRKPKVVNLFGFSGHGRKRFEERFFGGAHSHVRIEFDGKYVVAEEVMLYFVAELAAGQEVGCLRAMRF